MSNPCVMQSLTLSPSGGSLVSLIAFCSSEMGSPFSRAGGGSADRKRRKSACAPSDSLSTFFSSGPEVHSMVRWMFCRRRRRKQRERSDPDLLYL